MWAKIKARLAAAWAWIKSTALPFAGRVAMVALRALWAGAVAVFEAIRTQSQATGSTPGANNLGDIRKAAVGAAFAPSVVGVLMSVLIVALHGLSALVAVLPLGLLGTVTLFVVHFVTLLLVRLNHGYDPVGGLALQSAEDGPEPRP